MASTTKQMNITAGNAQATVNATVNDSMPAIPCPDPAGYRYVGARYVPLFADPLQWNSANTYEPLTIVIHEGNSYTSRTHVPVGIDIENEEYWALTANYNAQVEQYRQEVKAFDGRITAVENKTDEIEAELNADRYMVIFGDSWSSGNYSPNNLWWKNIGNQFGLVTKNYAVSGGSFTEYRGSVKTISQEIDTAISEITDKSKVEKIYVLAGVNDCFNGVDLGSVTSIVNSTIAKIRNNFNKAELIFSCDIPSILHPTMNANTISTFIANMAYACSYSKVKFYDLSSMSYCSNLYLDDQLHPNDLGMGYVAEIMLGGKWKYPLSTKIALDGDDYINFGIDESKKLTVKLSKSYPLRDIGKMAWLPQFTNATVYSADNTPHRIRFVTKTNEIVATQFEYLDSDPIPDTTIRI